MNPARNIHVSGIMDTGWYRDRIGDVDIVLVYGKMTEQSFEHFLAEGRRVIDECPDDARVAMLQEALDPALMDSAWRKRVAELLKTRRTKLARTRAAYAMVTPSLLVRSALTMLHWAAPPPYPYAVVASIREACEFIARHVPGLDAEELRAEYERRRTLVLTGLGRG